MKVAIVTARILLGSIFVVFGLNGFLHFLPQPPMPEAAAWHCSIVSKGQLVMWPVTSVRQYSPARAVLAFIVPRAAATTNVAAGTPSLKDFLIFDSSVVDVVGVVGRELCPTRRWVAWTRHATAFNDC